MGFWFHGTTVGTHPVIDVLIHLLIYVTMCDVSNVCRLLMTTETPASQIQGRPTARQLSARNRQQCNNRYNFMRFRD